MAVFIDKAAILAALRDNDNKIGRAAKALDISRRTLQNQMRHFGVPRGQPGRRRGRLRYRVSSGLVTAGAAAAGLLLAGALYRRTKT